VGKILKKSYKEPDFKYIYIYIKGDHESIKTNSQMILTSEIFLLVNLALKYALQVSFLD
jgi:hypothetical protein